MGVPLIANRSISKRGGCQAPLLYANDQISAVKEDRKRCGHQALTKAELAPMRKTFCTQFRTIDAVQLQKYLDLANEMNEKRAEFVDAGSIRNVYDAEKRFGLSSQDEAVRSEVITQMFADWAQAGNLGGMTRAASALRGRPC